MSAVEIRRACRAYAEEYIGIQREEFKRLGVGGLWDRPYTTMAYPYEAEIARAFGGIYGKNLVYQALKSVRWCFTDRTALAEAELEYEERQDPGDLRRVPDRAAGSPTRTSRPRFLIWTTTPWTIPSNLAIAVHPDENYVVGRGRRTAGTTSWPSGSCLASSRRARLDELEAAAASCRADARGHRLRASAPARVPRRAHGRGRRASRSASFSATTSPWTPAPASCTRPPATAKTTSSPGSARSLPILSPVDEAGRFTTVAKYRGQKVLDANPAIVEDLKAVGALAGYDPKFRHEYPHCWRCKNPVIFRATIQWFARLDDEKTDVRRGALDAIAAREVDTRPGARRASPAWSRTGASGWSRASGAGARRSRCSTP